jgi:hypothetical protein
MAPDMRRPGNEQPGQRCGMERVSNQVVRKHHVATREITTRGLPIPWRLRQLGNE